jgi:hypothetical protein
MNARFLACLFALSGVLALPATAVEYTADVKPILAKHCVSCHGLEKQRASLRLDSARGIHEGGSSGSAVVPGKSAESLLIKAVLGSDEVKVMPPRGPRLAAPEIAILRAWIDEGAKVPASEVILASRAGQNHWSFRPIVRPPVPTVKDARWSRTNIDRFILARLDRERIRPSDEADRGTLVRRVYLDLIGLPPTPAEVDAFKNDRRLDAYERVVDRLLASSHYGERWGRHWLDQARYADSNGYSIDAARSIWKYRDWVVNALNADLPFDQFTVEQLAGDLLPGATFEQKIATGFHRNTQINEEGGIDLEQFRVEAIVDRVNTTGSVWLGLTIGCAQCHDHKYDPISQKDYYRLYAFFNNSDDPRIDLLSTDILRKRTQLQAEMKQLEKQLFTIEKLSEETLERWVGSLTPETRKTFSRRIQAILDLPPNGRNARQQQELWAAYRKADQVRHVTAGLAGPYALLANTHLLSKRQHLEKQIDRVRKAMPASITTMVVNERKMPRMTTIQLGGDFLRKGAVVDPAVPAVLPQLTAQKKVNRLDLARWLVDGKNPLTGRVLVNRLWQHYFGVGLVETENDFGTQGTRPTHPELLDWLADELVRQKWSLKSIHRLIVTSSVYRQSSHVRPDLRTIDPRNLLLARQNRLRLEAEIVRDVTLASSGLLTTTIGGPGVYPPQPAGVYSLTQVPKNWVASIGPDRFRRGMYTYFWRSAPHPGLTVFDAPDATATCTRRNRSNTPLQALTLLNDLAHLECARALAVRLLQEGREDGERLDLAYRLTLARRPTPREREILLALLVKQRHVLGTDEKEARSLVLETSIPGIAPAEQAAWVQLSRVLLNLDEFITRE